MELLDELRIKANGLLALSQDKNKYEIIKGILSYDDCFLKLTTENSLSILRDLGCDYASSIEMYKKLIDSDNIVKMKILN